MSTDMGLQGHAGGLLAGGLPGGEKAIAIADFLKDVRRVKRLTQLGVYTGIFVTLPVYYFALNFS